MTWTSDGLTLFHPEEMSEGHWYRELPSGSQVFLAGKMTDKGRLIQGATVADGASRPWTTHFNPSMPWLETCSHGVAVERDCHSCTGVKMHKLIEDHFDKLERKRLYDAETEVESLTKRLRKSDELIRQMREQLADQANDQDKLRVELTDKCPSKVATQQRRQFGTVVGYDHGYDWDET